jgi:hypothetical protein
MVAIKLSELLIALEFSSVSGAFDSGAFIHRSTGEIQRIADGIELDETLCEDVQDKDKYLPVPHKNDLDLGRSLAIAFIEKFLPDAYGTVADYFRKRGAYRKFKHLLERRGALDAWHLFEAQATEQALTAWCKDHAIQLVT